jgi:type IV pilus assembly protein PilX
MTYLSMNRVMYTHHRLIRARHQSGVVLIIAMMMLIIISLASVNAMRSATTNEVVANNARGQALAMQAAEAGLRYCETNVVTYLNAVVASGTATVTATAVVAIAAAPVAPTPYLWETLDTNWDAAAAAPSLVPLSLINNSSTSVLTTYQRQPECLAQYLDPGKNTKAVITARGFGPEVTAVTAGSSRKPVGTEVWLQSNIQIYSP